MKKILESNGKVLSLDRPILMGVLNVTPDSFSDGGQYADLSQAVEHALAMIENGADIVDVGGESSGPDSVSVSIEEEIDRIIPVVKALREKTDAWISVDTWKSQVARVALEAGADMINDISALRFDEALADVVAEFNVPIVLMYSKDSNARTTKKMIDYHNVVGAVGKFLEKRMKFACSRGIDKDNIILDPGMGAFISVDEKYSLEILNRLDEFRELKRPILIGPSRKSFIGRVLNVDVADRLEGSLGCAAIAVLNGASIVRVHDVRETKRIIDMVWAVKNFKYYGQ